MEGAKTKIRPKIENPCGDSADYDIELAFRLWHLNAFASFGTDKRSLALSRTISDKSRCNLQYIGAHNAAKLPTKTLFTWQQWRRRQSPLLRCAKMKESKTTDVDGDDNDDARSLSNINRKRRKSTKEMMMKKQDWHAIDTSHIAQHSREMPSRMKYSATDVLAAGS